jgi:hypothetical protein
MSRNTETGAVKYRCQCGTEVPGQPIDARIGGEVYGASETAQLYDRLIRSAPFDRANTVVKQDCPSCGLDYMYQIRVGDAEVIIIRCKCGYETGVGSADEGAAGAAPPPAAPPRG